MKIYKKDFPKLVDYVQKESEKIVGNVLTSIGKFLRFRNPLIFTFGVIVLYDWTVGFY